MHFEPMTSTLSGLGTRHNAQRARDQADYAYEVNECPRKEERSMIMKHRHPPVGDET